MAFAPIIFKKGDVDRWFGENIEITASVYRRLKKEHGKYLFGDLTEVELAGDKKAIRHLHAALRKNYTSPWREILTNVVKAALEAETARVAQLEKFQKDFRTLAANGQLAAAEALLNETQRAGLPGATYEKCAAELTQRRAEAMQHIQAGDDLLREEHYKEARVRYEQARKIDRDNTLVAGKIEMADRFEREARSRNVRATVGFVVPVAVQTIGEYFEFKREQERRKREEEERKREEAERAAEEERNKQRPPEPGPINRPPRRPQRSQYPQP